MPLPTQADAVTALALHLDESDEDETVIGAAQVALDMVEARFTFAELERVPASVGKLAVVEAGAAIYYRRTARNGITTFGSTDVMPMRIAKDPLSTVYPIIAPYVTPGFA